MAKQLSYYIIGVTAAGRATTLIQGRGSVYEFRALTKLQNPGCDILLDEATLNGLIDKLFIQLVTDGACDIDMISCLDGSSYSVQWLAEELYISLVSIRSCLPFGGKYYINITTEDSCA